jgi:chemotaxis signal transduction protein
MEAPWLRFEVGESPYAIPLHAVPEVTAGARPRLIPLVPIQLGGIINVRGEPLPVVDGGVLLRNQSANAYRHVLVLENKATRIGVLVGHVTGLERTVSSRPAQEDAGEDGMYVRWVIVGKEKLGLIDPKALLERAKELLTGKRSQSREESCPRAF